LRLCDLLLIFFPAESTLQVYCRWY
jgi:hypothetical protein